VKDLERYSLQPINSSGTAHARSRRWGWYLLAGAAFVLFMGFLTVEATGALFTADARLDREAGNTRNRTISRPLQTLATATPRPQIVVQPPAEGVDYETAVLVNIYEQVNPSVVNISVYARGDSIHGEAVPGLDPDSLLPTSGGSGFVWDADGHIVTNNHVVDGADRIVVKFSDGTMSLADVVGTDEDSDLAVIAIDPVGYALVPVLRGRLEDVRVGQRVAAIGNPFGLEGTLTSGIVSAIGRSIPSRASFSIPASIQTDAPINPGNSGGPLLNERGEVIGVNAQIRSEERANSGVGFAIPISIVERVVPSLIENGRYDHPYIGISGETFSPICADLTGYDPTLRGAIVVDVLRGTPAARAGLQGGTRDVESDYPDICPRRVGGDLIVAVNDTPIASFDDVLGYLQRFSSPGDTVDFTVLRDGESLSIPVTLDVRPRSN